MQNNVGMKKLLNNFKFEISIGRPRVAKKISSLYKCRLSFLPFAIENLLRYKLREICRLNENSCMNENCTLCMSERSNHLGSNNAIQWSNYGNN